MKQTAVEWFVEQLAAITKQNSGYRNIEIELKELIEQAKAMEKEQIIEAVYYQCSSMSHSDLPCGEQYYNETFKSE